MSTWNWLEIILGGPQKGSGLAVDPASVELRDRARKIAEEQKVEYGEALRRARQELGGKPGTSIPVDPRSVRIRDTARQLVESEGINLAEALRRARRLVA